MPVPVPIPEFANIRNAPINIFNKPACGRIHVSWTNTNTEIIAVKMVYLKEDVFGQFNNEPVRRFTWTTNTGLVVSVISYGATITSIKLPDVYNTVKDIALGFDDMPGYLRSDNPYFGTTVGRCANRIANGRFDLNGQTYQLAKNVGGNHLHGGIVGFDKVNWKANIEGTKVIFSYLSKNLEEGYPGDLVTTVTYQVDEDDALCVEFVSNTTLPTVVNLTNHSYFNLAGHETGAQELYNHVIAVNADRITAVDDKSIPTGQFQKVGGTPFDLRTAVKLGDVIGSVPPGFDHNFCITKDEAQGVTFVSRVVHPQTGRFLEVYSDQPGVQLYTSNFLPAPDQPAVPGKSGAGYRRHGAFCLETQNYPDAINHGNFPSPVVTPGSPYRHRVKYYFGNTQDKAPFVSGS